MRAAVIPQIRAKWEIRDIPVPKPAVNQVLIKFMQVDYVIVMYILQKENYLFL
jgi:hypothetical protein